MAPTLETIQRESVELAYCWRTGSLVGELGNNALCIAVALTFKRPASGIKTLFELEPGRTFESTRCPFASRDV